MPELPPILARYFATMERGALDAFARCFAEDAVVTDEGRTHRGRADIIAWRAAANARYRITTTPETIARRGGETVVTALIEGDFPKAGLPDPLRLEYRFGIRDDLIHSLAIGLPR